MAVGVGIDEAGMNEAASGGDFAGTLGRGTARWPQFADRIVLDQDVGRFRRTGTNVEDQPAAQHRVGHCLTLPDLDRPM